MIDLSIENGIPLPIDTGPKYGFRSMAVGESFRVNSIEDRGRVMSSAHKFGRTRAGIGWTFISRKDGDGYRIWRKS